MKLWANRPPQAKVTPEGRVLRTDIQALRAFAVAAVVIYHLWPRRLSGGFVGVDIFFVISGYLITSHLLAHPPRSLGSFGQFWARRARRLLPASLLVLGLTLLGSHLWAPQTQWSNTARDIKAAALYVSNWVFAGDSVDYLAAAAAPSPVQHFWSLSVEEQFYLGWPIVIALLVLLSGWVKRRHLVTLGIAVVVAASLAWSIHKTSVDPAAAYFVTPTRIWELAAGGLLAAAWQTRWVSLLRSCRVWLRSTVFVAAGAAALWTMVVYSGADPFPGWRAAIPVGATVAMIALSHDASDGLVGWLGARAPIQWLGRVSYSVYLWHWPIFILLGDYLGHALAWPQKFLVIAATGVLSHASVVLVEDPCRKLGSGRHLRWTFGAAASAMAVVVFVAGLQQSQANNLISQDRTRLAQALAHPTPCFGAAALQPDKHCPPVAAEDIVPAPVLAAQDKSNAYSEVSGGKNCWSFLPSFPEVTCEFGKPQGTHHIELVGNSHAGQWLPALEALAAGENWHVRTRLASRCALATTRQQVGGAAQNNACLRWVHRTVAGIIADRPDLVVMANRLSAPAVGATGSAGIAAYRQGYLDVLKQLAEAHIRVLIVRDTPASGDAGLLSIPDCVAQHADDLTQCSGSRADWLPPDPSIAAEHALGDKNLTTVDLTDHLCGPTRCEGVVGGVIVYFDGSHMTATYARTLAPYLGNAIRPLLNQSASR